MEKMYNSLNATAPKGSMKFHFEEFKRGPHLKGCLSAKVNF